MKLGQILSTRVDLFEEPFLEEISALQDRVPPFPFDRVVQTIETELRRPLDEVFASFDEVAVAAGSVAQVHRAVLRSTGEDVAVKVRRPDIAARVAVDRSLILALARRIARSSRAFRLLSIEDAAGEFCDAIERQLDFAREAASGDRFRAMVASESDWIVPRAVPEASSSGVLTAEWVAGCPESDIERSAIDVDRVVTVAVRGICRSIFLHGFVHADLHPGNVRFFRPGGIVVVDYGLMAELDDDARASVTRIFFAIATGDGRDLARHLYDDAPVRAVRDYAAYEAEMTRFVDDVSRRSLERLHTLDAVGRMFGILRRHGIRARGHLTMVYVSLLAVEGLAKRLRPDLLFFEAMLPWVAEGAGLVPAPSRVEAAPTDAGPEDPSRPPEPAVTLGSERYRLIRVLGEGEHRRIFLARDTTLDRDVAVSVFEEGAVDPVRRARLEAAVRATASFGTHPHVVTVHDFGEERGLLFVVGEYMAGGTLAELLASFEGRGLPVRDAVRIALDVSRALAHAHAHHVAHGDVRPGNVWLTPNGSAKLGAFELAFDRDTLAPPAACAPTEFAPARHSGIPIDAGADVNGLGRLFHEMLTGSPPFDDEASRAAVRSGNGRPEPPSRLYPHDVPLELEELVLQCLADDPADRPTSITEVEEALARVAKDPLAPSSDSTMASWPANAVFVGREREMARLLKALDEALAGRGRLSLLVGDPGIGKTRLATELAVHARRRGALVLVGHCHEGEGAPAFWPWVQVIGEYVRQRDARALERELGSAVRDIAQLVPEARALSGPRDSNPSRDRRSARASVRGHHALSRCRVADATHRHRSRRSPLD